MKKTKNLLGLAFASASMMLGMSSGVVGTNAVECKHRNWEWTDSESATCEHDGYQSISHCKDCGIYFDLFNGNEYATFEEYKSGDGFLPATGHLLNSYYTITDTAHYRVCSHFDCEIEDYSTTLVPGVNYGLHDTNGENGCCSVCGYTTHIEGMTRIGDTNLFYKVTDNGMTLTIDGFGKLTEMDNYPYDKYGSTIKRLIINEHVAEIPFYCFYSLRELTDITIYTRNCLCYQPGYYFASKFPLTLHRPHDVYDYDTGWWSATQKSIEYNAEIEMIDGFGSAHVESPYGALCDDVEVGIVSDIPGYVVDLASVVITNKKGENVEVTMGINPTFKFDRSDVKIQCKLVKEEISSNFDSIFDGSRLSYQLYADNSILVIRGEGDLSYLVNERPFPSDYRPWKDVATQITTVVIDGKIKVGSQTFSNENIQNLYFTDKVLRVGDSAFTNFDTLQAVYFSGNTAVNSYAFDGCGGPAEKINLYYDDSNWSNGEIVNDKWMGGYFKKATPTSNTVAITLPSFANATTQLYDVFTGTKVCENLTDFTATKFTLYELRVTANEGYGFDDEKFGTESFYFFSNAGVDSTNLPEIEEAPVRTLTVNLEGGTFESLPEDWLDLGDGKYSRDFTAGTYVANALQTLGMDPTKEGCTFDSWSYTDAVITENISVSAEYKLPEPHEHVYFAASQSTCLESGHPAYYYCYDCGLFYEDDAEEVVIGNITAFNEWLASNEVAPSGHSYGDPTYSWNGDVCTATIECSSCNDKITETAHGMFVLDTEEDHENSRKGHYVAEFFNSLFETQTTAANSVVVANTATGHIMGDPVYTWNGKECTATSTCNCGHAVSETKTGTYVKDADANHFYNEVGHYEVSFDNPAFEDQKTAVGSVEILETKVDHTYYAEIYFLNDSNTFYVYGICECGSTICMQLPGNYVMDTPATATTNEKGHFEVYCELVNNILSTAPNSYEVPNSATGYLYTSAYYEWDGNSCTATIVGFDRNLNTKVISETQVGTYVKDTDATCTENEKGHFEVSFNNPAFEDQRTAKNSYEVPNSKLGHDWEEVTYTWENGFCTAERVCKNDRDHVETETVKGVYIKDSNGTCTENEKGHLVAFFENPDFETQTLNGVEKEGTMKEHDYTDVSYTWNDDHTECTAKATCADCGDVIEETVKAEKHGKIYYASFTNAALASTTYEASFQWWIIPVGVAALAIIVGCVIIFNRKEDK